MQPYQRARRWLLTTFNVNFRRKQYGCDVVIPVRSRVHSWYETEPYLLPIIKCLLEARKGTFVDVGASLGQTLVKVKAASPTTRYIGVEPIPACANYLRELIRCNEFVRSDVVCCAVASKGGLAKLFTRANISEVSSLVPESRNDDFFDDYLYVPVVSGDLLIASSEPVGEIAALKIDVEGAEWDALHSFHQTIARSRAPVLFEFLPIETEFRYGAMKDDVIAQRREHARKLREEFEDHRFDIYQVMGTGRVRLIRDFPSVPSHAFEEINFVAVDREAPSPLVALTE